MAAYVCFAALVLSKFEQHLYDPFDLSYSLLKFGDQYLVSTKLLKDVLRGKSSVKLTTCTYSSAVLRYMYCIYFTVQVTGTIYMSNLQ